MFEAHATKYKDNAWLDYSIQELGNFIHLFVKRASMRADPEKRAKDFYDARNYLKMIELHIEATEASV